MEKHNLISKKILQEKHANVSTYPRRSSRLSSKTVKTNTTNHNDITTAVARGLNSSLPIDAKDQTDACPPTKTLIMFQNL